MPLLPVAIVLLAITLAMSGPSAASPASPRAITQAEEALLWLRWLEKDDARLLWLRANRKPWKPICWELGISRATANRRWQYGIAAIVWRLNGKSVPRKRSMDFVVAKAAD